VQSKYKLYVNLLFSNGTFYNYKTLIDFDICIIIYLKIDDFKAPFQILRTVYNPVVRRVTFCKDITLYLKETVYTRMDYIGLPSRRDFKMIRTYPTVSNTILNIKTSKIIILANLIKKTLKIG